VRLTAGSFTDRGRVRDTNEDAHLVDERLALFAVADGMGGHRAGEVASWTAIEALRAAVADGRSVSDAIERANEAVFERAAADPDLGGMGTTMTAIVVAGGRRLLIGHVGDSRAYLLHDGALRRLTDDHSLVEELVREGRLTPEQAEAHPQRAIITRALGVDGEIDVDVYTVTVDAGDRLLVCSDGLTTMVRDRDVERIVRDADNPQRAAEELVDAANSAGGEDNVTVVVVEVVEVDEEAPPDPEQLAAPAAAATPAVEPAPDVAAPTSPPPRPPLRRRVRAAVLVVVPLVLIFAVAVGALGWYARRSYYVGHDGEVVVLYKGVPGGVLGWDPTVERRTKLRVDDLLAVDRAAVDDGAARGSRADGERYIERLRDRVAATSTTTTTRRAPTTTTRPRTSTTRATAPRPPGTTAAPAP
jgi:protein phosphatase